MSVENNSNFDKSFFITGAMAAILGGVQMNNFGIPDSNQISVALMYNAFSFLALAFFKNDVDAPAQVFSHSLGFLGFFTLIKVLEPLMQSHHPLN